jgi:hypothetical protein
VEVPAGVCEVAILFAVLDSDGPMLTVTGRIYHHFLSGERLGALGTGPGAFGGLGAVEA